MDEGPVRFFRSVRGPVLGFLRVPPRRWVVSVAASVSSSTVVVAVDVGKNCVALSVTDAGRHRLFGPVEFAMTRPALDRGGGQDRCGAPFGRCGEGRG
jgi:hypothetical protein